MTTPAISRSDITTRTGRDWAYRFYPAPPGIEFDGTQTTPGKWDIESRPASGTAGRIKSFKLCRPFDHYKAKWETLPSKFIITYIVVAPPYKDEETIENGTFWVSGVTPPVPVMPSSNMINWATVKALNKLKEQDIHLGNFIGEFHKTVEMIATNARTIAKQVTNFRKRFPKDWLQVKRVQTGGLPRHRWCEIPNRWLELQYGWKPLLSDIQGGLNHLFKENKRSMPYILAKATVKDEVLTEQNVIGAKYGIHTKTLWLSERFATVALAYRVTNPVVHELSSLGLLNPLEIVWEVTKYSFVVDWFLPIGPWMSALTGDAGLEFITGTVSKFSKLSFRGDTGVDLSGVDPHITCTGSGPVYEGFAINLDRGCLSSTPFPGLYVKNPMSALHAANALHYWHKRSRDFFS